MYNRYWSTGGGAETYGGAVAELLSRRGQVELLAHEDLDTAALSERLALDLSRCSVRVVPPTSAAVTRAGADADLFVNVSHRSRDANGARRGLYVVHFPTSLGAASAGSAGASRLEWGTGFHPSDGRVTWTDGEGELLVVPAADRPTALTLLLGFARPDDVEVRVLLEGQERAVTRLAGPRTPLERWSGRAVRLTVPAGDPARALRLTLVSSAFVPGADDPRHLGVPVLGAALGRGAALRWARRSRPPAGSTAWLDSYDAVVSNAAFTQGWVRRRWQRGSDVLHPPVALRAPGAKEPVVLGVGRFFPRGKGHSKKQLELVQAFRRLQRPGWSLHLVGGCAPDGQAYLETVRAEAEGLDVHLHPNASGAELADLYARASVFWHATGLGEDPDAHPDRLEHFGISVVEAMSAGAVPVVLRAGGLVETVRDGRDGVLVDDVEGFARETAALVDDPGRLTSLSASCRERARAFSLEAFDVRLQELLGRLGV